MSRIQPWMIAALVVASGALASVPPSSGPWGSPAAMRAALGFNDPAVAGQTIVLASDVTEATSAADATLTGLGFTPDPNDVYLVQVQGWAVGASTSAGIEWRIELGAQNLGGCEFYARGGTATAEAVFNGAAGNGPSDTRVLGTSAPSASNYPMYISGSCMFVGGASPDAISVVFQSAAAAACTVKAGTFMTYTKIVDN